MEQVIGEETGKEQVGWSTESKKVGRTVNLNTELVEDRYKRKFVIRKRRLTIKSQ